METKIFQLADGRQLAYLDIGPNDGPTVVFMHGIPGCRLGLDEEYSAAVNAGLRVIKPDRPGWGRSDPLPRRAKTICDFAPDLEQLLDYLGIERFAVWGISAGGPHVMGTIHHFRDRVTVGFIMSGLSDLSAPQAREGMMFLNRLAADVCLKAPWLFRAGLKLLGPIMFRPKNFVRIMAAQMAEEDREQIDRVPYFTEALRQGVNAYIDEASILFGLPFPWGVDLQRLEQVPLYWWQGGEDKNVPAIHGEIFKQRLPHTQLTIFPGEGHLSYIDKHAEAVAEIFIKHFTR